MKHENSMKNNSISTKVKLKNFIRAIFKFKSRRNINNIYINHEIERLNEDYDKLKLDIITMQMLLYKSLNLR